MRVIKHILILLTITTIFIFAIFVGILLGIVI